MRTDHTPDDRRTESDPRIPAYDDPVDVALEVALDLADDRDVRRYIRRARQARIAEVELDDGAGTRTHRRETDDGALEDGGTA